METEITENWLSALWSDKQDATAAPPSSPLTKTAKQQRKTEQ